MIGEKKFMVDREKAKKARGDLEAFLNYARFMKDLLTVNHKDWSKKYSAENWLYNKERGNYHLANGFGEVVDSGWLNRKEGEDIGEHWINGVEALCLVLHQSLYDRMKDTYVESPATFEEIEAYVKGADRLYRFARPYNEVEVPVGKPFYSNGRDI